MRARIILAGAGLLLLAAGASAKPELPAPSAPMQPEPDITPMKLMGAAARDRNGPDPIAAPPADLGMTPDPDEVPGGQVDTPVKK